MTSPPAVGTSDRRPKALIVDLDESILIRLEFALENEGIDTTAMWDPRQACHELATGTYDVLLVAHHYPQIDAHEALKCRKEVPCIVLLPRALHPFAEGYWEALGAAATVSQWAIEKIVLATRACLATSRPRPVHTGSSPDNTPRTRA